MKYRVETLSSGLLEDGPLNDGLEEWHDSMRRRGHVAVAIAMLQRELLVILRGEHRARGAWYSRAGIMGFAHQWAPLWTAVAGLDRVKALRTRILELDPQACIYATWGGELPDGFVMPKTYWERKREA